jgi:signal transduction histidine kinase
MAGPAHSLRLRLLAAAAVSTVLALAAIAWLLLSVLDDFIEGRVRNDLIHQLDEVAAHLTVGGGGGPALDARLADPRYERPLSGLYLQIDSESKARLRSRSLWDFALDISTMPAAGEARMVTLQGPGESRLFALARDVMLRDAAGQRHGLRIAVAVDRAESDAARAHLLTTVSLGLGIACAGLILASWAQIFFGLRPMESVRREIARIRAGTGSGIDTGSVPVEIRPLAEEINALLETHRADIAKARRRAGDLAHGLKTPLAALAAQADLMERKGLKHEAGATRAQIDAMHRYVVRELALARAQGASEAASLGANPKAELEAIVATLDRLPAPRPIAFRLDVRDGIVLAMDSDDFAEVAGNLMENARKWAASQVDVSIVMSDGRAVVAIADDGPGIPETARGMALSRGGRLDESVQGSGLGLSIVTAVLESYGSSLELAPSPAGGLLARFSVPARQIA